MGGGLVALAGAVWLFVAGSGWGGFWLAVIAAGLLAREPMRRYWERVERDDPAAPALRAAWMCALMALLGLGLGISQLTGVGFRTDAARGFLGLLAAMICVAGGAKALRDHRRIRDADPDAPDFTQLRKL